MKERFLSKVNVSENCWEWLACKNGGGYGLFWFGGWMQKAHRVSWIIYNGSIPESMHVLHKCDNRNCVNPDHLFLGTNVDNVSDKVRKGRQSSMPGEKHPMAKVTFSEVSEIREWFAKGLSQTRLAEMYGLTPSGIWRIVRNKTWTCPRGRFAL